MENDIGLRSEGLRKMAGRRLPWYIRMGTVVVALVVAFLLAVAFFVPLPMTRGDGKSVEMTLWERIRN